MKMDKFSAMIPMSLRLDLEYLANKYDVSISTLVRAFLSRCVDEAMAKEEEDEQNSKMGCSQKDDGID